MAVPVERLVVIGTDPAQRDQLGWPTDGQISQRRHMQAERKL
jgi:hypothetical protein